jgi:hypothetical protein
MHRLFAFADRRDAAMMTVGALAAVVNGLAMQLFDLIIYGVFMTCKSVLAHNIYTVHNEGGSLNVHGKGRRV